MIRALVTRIEIALFLIRTLGPSRLAVVAVLRNRAYAWFVRKLVLKERRARAVIRRLQFADWTGLDTVRVSFVIPNNNGLAVGLEALIRSIQAQTHHNIEIIAVDSGSTDQSVAVLRSLGVQVHEIPPEQFSHSYSRNLGASKASGDFLVFTVSDAEFKDRDWVRKNLALLETYGAASVTTPQGYTNEASAYARLLAGYLNARFPASPGILVTKPKAWAARMLPSGIAGQAFGVDDTNHMVRARDFHALRFERNTVEDMDFGKRLFQAGRPMILSSMTSIRHYHDYGNSYKYFCRVYCDMKVIRELTHTTPAFFSYESLVAVLPSFGISLLNVLRDFFKESGRPFIPIENFARVVKDVFDSEPLGRNLNWSVREEADRFLREELRLEPGGWSWIRNGERLLLVKRLRASIEAAIVGIRRAKRDGLSEAEAIEVARCSLIQVLAACFAELPAEGNPDPRFAALAAIRWK